MHVTQNGPAWGKISCLLLRLDQRQTSRCPREPAFTVQKTEQKTKPTSFLFRSKRSKKRYKKGPLKEKRDTMNILRFQTSSTKRKKKTNQNGTRVATCRPYCHIIMLAPPNPSRQLGQNSDGPATDADYTSAVSSRRTSAQSTIGDLPEFPSTQHSSDRNGDSTPLSTCDTDSTSSTPTAPKLRPTPTSDHSSESSRPNSAIAGGEKEGLNSDRLSEFLKQLQARPAEPE